MQLAGDGRKSIGGIFRLMRPVNLLILCVVAMSVAWPAPAHARKVALIIANSAYGSIDDPVETRFGSLRNPATDAAMVKESAEAAGFVAEIVSDLDRSRMIAELDKFAAKAERADVAMIYYAGHGVEIAPDGFGAGGQFVIPVDAKLGSDLVMAEGGVNVMTMARALRGASNAILVIDACRDQVANPGATTYRSATLRNVPQVPGVFVLLSTGPNKPAEEGTAGEGSPFAQEFALRFKKPGISLSDLSNEVGTAVNERTKGQQLVFQTAGGGLGNLVFGNPVERQRTVRPEDEGYAWDEALGTKTVAAFVEFENKYPNSQTYGGRVIAQLAVLNTPEADAAMDSILAKRRAANPSIPAPASGGQQGGSGDGYFLRPPDETNFGGDDLAHVQGGDRAGGSTTRASVEPQQNPVLPASPSGAGLLQPGQSGVEQEQIDTGPAPDRPFTPPSQPAPNGPSGAGDFAPRQPPGGEAEGPAAGLPDQRPVVPQEQPLARPQPRPERVNDSPGCEVATTASEVNAALLRGVTPCGMVDGDSAALVDKKPLPALPGPPKFSDIAYPACRNEFEALTSDFEKLNSIVACQAKINKYYSTEMEAFSNSISDYLKGIYIFYDTWVTNPSTKLDYTPDTQVKFMSVVIKGIHEKCQPGGEYMKDYEAAAQRRLDDLAFLTQQYDTIKARYPL